LIFFGFKKRRDKMKTERFKILVEALEALPEGIRNNKVNMSGVDGA
jgi:hypothetical protein